MKYCICTCCWRRQKGKNLCAGCERVDCEIGACDYCHRHGPCKYCGGVLIRGDFAKDRERVFELLSEVYDDLRCIHSEVTEPIAIRIWDYLMGEE